MNNENDDRLPESFTPPLDQSPPTVQQTPTTLSGDGVQKPLQNKPIIAVLSILLLIVLGVATFVGYQYLKLQNKTANTVPTSNEQTDTGVVPSGTSQPSLSEVTIQTSDVEWLSEPQKVQSVGFFTVIDQNYPYKLEYCKSGTDCSKLSELSDKYEPKTTYYKVGTMRSQYSGSPVYLAITKNLPTTHVYKGIGTEKDIVYDSEVLSIFIKTSDNKFIVTNDYQNGLILCRGGCQQDQLPPSNEGAGIIYKHDLSLDKVGSGNEYTDSNSGIKFQITRTNHFFSNSGLFLVKDFGQGYALYSNQDIKSNPIRLKTVINPTFVIKLPTNLVADVYQGSYGNGLLYQKGTSGYSPSSDTTQLIWTASDKPLPLPKEPSDKGIVTDYTAIAYTTDYDGCKGNMTLDGIASDGESLDVNSNLTQVATTDKGDTIYDVKSKDFKIFQQFWFWKVSLNGLDSVTYNDYLALKPILIQKNKLGVYRMVFRDDLVSSKCWGEPLIYLYPEKPTNVQVKLDKVIDLTKSEPAYNNGWNLLAYPDGNLYSQAKQRQYPYLFWEGSAPIPSLPVARKLVERNNIHNYFEEALTTLGLNDKEKQDFEKYWEPQLKDSPYYLISFFDAEQLDRLAPLQITPKPDTSIRVLMTYDRLDSNNIELPSIELNSYQTPNRNGFVIVEWGGILHRLNY